MSKKKKQQKNNSYSVTFKYIWEKWELVDVQKMFDCATILELRETIKVL